MNKNKKKTISVLLSISMLATVSGTTVYEVMNNKNVKRDVNRFFQSTFLSVDYAALNGISYKDFDYGKKDYYVLEKNNKLIISDKKKVDGYKLLGEYNSTNSCEEVFYFGYSTDDGETTSYQTLSYDDLEKDDHKIFNTLEENEVVVIDENSPDNVSAYVPKCSIKKIK